MACVLRQKDEQELRTLQAGVEWVVREFSWWVDLSQLARVGLFFVQDLSGRIG